MAEEPENPEAPILQWAREHGREVREMSEFIFFKTPTRTTGPFCCEAPLVYIGYTGEDFAEEGQEGLVAKEAYLCPECGKLYVF